MAPRKGLSFEEKRDRLQELFTETADFFTLKELEKIAAKKKGIVSQSVKEVLQSLVDDSLVNTDKCGVQTVFWALPSEASQKKKARLAQLESELADATAEEKRLTAQVAKLEEGREESAERTKALDELRVAEDKVAETDGLLARFAELDPEEMERLAGETKRVKGIANRWVDNIFNCQSWAMKTFSMEKKAFDAQFEIPEELDYVE